MVFTKAKGEEREEYSEKIVSREKQNKMIFTPRSWQDLPPTLVPSE